jgi:Bacterial extracellular solute-binding protein
MTHMKRLVGPILALLVLAGVGFAGWRSYEQRALEQTAKLEAAKMETVRGLIGSEKESFFNDPRVIAILQKNALTVQIEKAGSRAIAQRADLKSFDFAHPAGAPAALKIQQVTKAQQIFTPFFTPMVIASWKTLIPVLEREGLVKQEAGTYYVVDMPKLMAMMDKGTRWKDLKGNDVYATSKSVLVSSTDVRKSNSGAMYLALASYVANGNNVVQSEEELQKVLPLMSNIFLKQGFQESSSAGPFDDYLSMGIGKAPMVMIYESQFLEYLAKQSTANPRSDMVLLYPRPTIFSKHVFVALNAKGAKLGALLESDPGLQALALEYGYRTSGQEAFALRVADKKLPIPITLVDVVDPPSFEILERMVVDIEKKYSQ